MFLVKRESGDYCWTNLIVTIGPPMPKLDGEASFAILSRCRESRKTFRDLPCYNRI